MGLLNDPALVVATARTADERRRLQREELGRRWAAEHGIPTPAVVASDPDGRWLVGERVEEAGVVPLGDALEIAARIARAPVPDLGIAPSTWRASPLTRPLRALMLPTVGVSPMTFLRVRAAAADLPRDHSVHGDFHPGNLLRSGAGPVVVDWEHLGAGYARADELRFLTTQPLDVSIPEVESMMLSAGRVERRRIVACFRWLTLRNLAGHADLARHRTHLEDVAVLRERWRVVDAFAEASIGGSGR